MTRALVTAFAAFGSILAGIALVVGTALYRAFTGGGIVRRLLYL